MALNSWVRGVFVRKLIASFTTVIPALCLQTMVATVPYAQTTNEDSGIFRGQVIDSLTQRPLSNAQIVLIYNGTNLTQTVTDSSGQFEIDDVAEGVYTLRVSATAYRIASDQNVRAVAGKVTLTNFALIAGL